MASLGQEIFVNATVATVSSGGTTSPAAGTVETWTVSGGTWPVLNSGRQFRIIDALDEGLTSNYEVILVTAIAGTSWTVVRGVEGTVRAHTAGLHVVPAVSAAALLAIGPYIPGIVTDGTTDNWATLNNYQTLYLATFPDGGIPPQAVPPGLVAISQTFVNAVGSGTDSAFILRGSGNCVMEATTFSNTGPGTWLMPTSSFTGSQIVRFDNNFSSIRDINVDAGTAVNSAIQVNAGYCSVHSSSFFRGLVGTGGITFDSTNNAQALHITGAWNIRGTTNDSANCSLQAQGGDWIVNGGRVTHGGKLISVQGGIWSGVHFTNSGSSASLSGACNVNEQGGSVFNGCYFDSCAADATAMIVRSGVSSEFNGCRYYQNTTGVTGIPVFSIGSEISNGGTIVNGGWLKINGSVSSWFSAFMDSAGPTDSCSNITAEQGYGAAGTSPMFSTSLPGTAIGNQAAGITFPEVGNTAVIAQTASFTLAISDVGAVEQVSNASAVTCTVPPNSSVPIPIGATVQIIQFAAGKVQIVAGASVVIHAAGGFTSGTTGTHLQYSLITLTKIALNTWILSGDFA